MPAIKALTTIVTMAAMAAALPTSDLAARKSSSSSVPQNNPGLLFAASEENKDKEETSIVYLVLIVLASIVCALGIAAGIYRLRDWYKTERARMDEAADAERALALAAEQQQPLAAHQTTAGPAIADVVAVNAPQVQRPEAVAFLQPAQVHDVEAATSGQSTREKTETTSSRFAFLRRFY
ncbi:hypothetical protein F4780DRAFT_446301 [Xylariomycetidae sp. FL0641]|nr:hypothetical protein F4780DRAFT_446301 [Xylariomycetidae sp. FL0641]